MDMHMPEMDGLEAAFCIMQMEVKSPIVALTANVMSNDRVLYSESGMHDCMGKPFTSQELWACLLKYLKPIDDAEASGKDIAAAKEAENDFQNMLKLDFYKGNKGMFAEITSALNANDIKLARRLTHTLKSNAALIERPGLRAVAAEMEALLSDGENKVQKGHIERLDEELEAVLRDLAPLVGYAKKPVKKTGALCKTEVLELFGKLKPLLSSNNTDCLEFIDELSGVEGSEALIEQMENFEFIPAAETLAGLERIMEER
jgi:CheY-like chemotaxis protein